MTATGWLAEVADRERLRAWVELATDQLHGLALQGPRSRAALSDVVWTPATQPSLAELRRWRFLIGRIGSADGVAISVSRTGCTGELGYEIFWHPSDGEAVWDAVWTAAEPLGCKPLGLEALDIQRIEAGLILAGHEFDDQVDPFEAGIGFAVALDDETSWGARRWWAGARTRSAGSSALSWTAARPPAGAKTCTSAASAS